MMTIVIPLYNKAHTIIRTLKSILGQTFTDFEVLIIDDGSTDTSVSEIENYTNDNRIRIIGQQNMGVSVARNVGIQEAKGDYIAFLDGDDEWLPEYLQKVTEAIEKHPEAGLFMSARFDQDVSKSIKHEMVALKYKNIICEADYFQNPHVFSHISATVIKRSILQENFETWGSFVPGHKYNEDFAFLFRVALHTKFVYFGVPLIIYNGGVEGQVTSALANNIRLKDAILFHNLVLSEWLSLSEKPKNFKIFMQYEIRHILLGYIREKKQNEMAEFCNSLDKNYSKFFPAFEWKQYCSGNTNKWMQYYIYLTKIRWRMRGYPRV
jgi:glycosyltransferase involved in cell wall biosynthesis